MQLSRVGLAALHGTLAVAVVLLFSCNTFAQHSSGGGGSSGGSSGGGSVSAGSSGGGGFHGGYSGGGSGSSGSSAGHSSGGSSSRSSTGHISSAGSASSQSGTSHSKTAHPNTAQTSQKRGFFSFLRHPVRKPEPTPKPAELVAKVRPPLCFKAPCPVCPAGQVHGGSGCEGTILPGSIRRICRAGESWANGGCLQQTWYQDECGGLRMMMERQAKRMQAADLDRQVSCVLGPWQQCAASASSAQSEAGFYQELQNKYQECQRRSPTGTHFSGFRVPGYSAGFSFESLSMR